MNEEEKKQYKSIVEQGLSIREASLILTPITLYNRLKKFKKNGDIVHGNCGKQNKKPLYLLVNVLLGGSKNMVFQKLFM